MSFTVYEAQLTIRTNDDIISGTPYKTDELLAEDKISALSPWGETTALA
jgi:hypothetical protein